MSDRLSALVFDLDGTLVETAADIHAVLSEILAESDLVAPALADVRKMIGDGPRALIERALIAIEAPRTAAAVDALHVRFRDRYAMLPCRFSEPYPHAREILAEFRSSGYRLGLCTNKPQAATEGLLTALDLDGAFDAVIGGDRLPGIRKPDPGHLAAVLAILDVQSASAVMIGDSHNDLLTARALGVPCILVSFGYTSLPARALGADLVVDSLAELPRALTTLGQNHPGLNSRT